MWQQWLQNPVRLGIATAVVVVFFCLLAYIGSKAFQPDMGLLFSQTDAADGGRIIERLQARSIPFDIQNGSDIYVPANDVSRLRMELAEEGLPSGGAVGYEIFDKNDMLGTTTAMMDLNHLRALEGELSKSIKTIQGVQSARVHLVLPKRELFSQTRTEASSSVLLRMKTSMRLSAGQAQSIQHLIAASVPNLLVDRISIIDDRGNLLARGRDNAQTELGGKREEMQAQQEERLSRAVEGLLEKTLGMNKARVEVHLEMDFDQMTTSSVDYNPDGQVARSIASRNESNTTNESVSNDTVSVQNALPDQLGAANSSKNQNQNQDETTQYEISTINKTHVKEPGTIKRMSVAVLVDGANKRDEKGQLQYAARTPDELKQLTTLVKTAVGFEADRGDVVEVVNMPFSSELFADETPLGMLQKMLNYVNISKIVELILLGIFALLVGLMVLRPLIASLTSPTSQHYPAVLAAAVAEGERGGRELNDMPDLSQETLPSVSSFVPHSSSSTFVADTAAMDHFEKLTEQTSTLVEDKPTEAINVLRSWMEKGEQS